MKPELYTVEQKPSSISLHLYDLDEELEKVINARHLEKNE